MPLPLVRGQSPPGPPSVLMTIPSASGKYLPAIVSAGDILPNRHAVNDME